MKLKQLVVLLVFGYSMWASPASANADEFIDWSGSVRVHGDILIVGTNKYSGDRVYILNPGCERARMQVIK